MRNFISKFNKKMTNHKFCDINIKKYLEMLSYDKETFEDIKVKGYLRKYLGELKRHFNLSDKKINLILFRVYKENIPKNKLQNFILMVKLICYKSYKKLLYKAKKGEI